MAIQPKDIDFGQTAKACCRWLCNEALSGIRHDEGLDSSSFS